MTTPLHQIPQPITHDVTVILLPYTPPRGRTLALRTALVAALFSGVMVALLLRHALRDRASGPLAAAVEPEASDAKLGLDPSVVELQRLRRQLVAAPENQNLKERIRQLDQNIRQRYFANRAHVDRGAYLLLGGLIVMVAALKYSASGMVPSPQAGTLLSPPANPRQMSASAARAVAIGGAVLVVGFVFLASRPVIALREGASPPPDVQPVPAPEIPVAQLAVTWPSFRGAGGDGIGPVTPQPTDWDGPSGRGVMWKAQVPLPGRNSPIVWDNSVFVSGATADQQQVYCFDADTGALRWSKPVTGPIAGTSIKVNDDTGFAAPTMATDGQRAFAIFPTGDLVAFDFTGKLVWQKSLGKINSEYGYASSLAIAAGRVIVQVNQGNDAARSNSALIAYDAATGNIAWTARRPVSAAWASPIVVHLDAGPVIVTASSPLAMAHRSDTGAEIWRANLLGNDVAPSPTYAAGKVIVAGEPRIAAVNIQSHGPVPASALLWHADDGIPDIPSPLATERFVLLAQNNGMLTCLDAKTGKPMWDHDLEAHIDASPALAGGVIYALDRDGVMHLLQGGDAFKQIGTAALGEPASASPAFAHGRIYLRGEHHLYCIGKGAEGGKP